MFCNCMQAVLAKSLLLQLQCYNSYLYMHGNSQLNSYVQLYV